MRRVAVGVLLQWLLKSASVGGAIGGGVGAGVANMQRSVRTAYVALALDTMQLELGRPEVTASLAACGWRVVGVEPREPSACECKLDHLPGPIIHFSSNNLEAI